MKILDIPTTLIDFPDEQSWVLDMVNAILIEVLSCIAQAEREKIRQRQKEGIIEARRRNKKFGRPRVEKPLNWAEVTARIQSGEISAVEGIRLLGIKRCTYYILKKRESEE